MPPRNSKILLPTLLSILIYMNSLHGDFVMDDSAAIVKNMDLRPNQTTLSDVFANDFWGTPIHTEDSHKSYRPLTVLTYRLNFWMHGLDTFGYHAVNVLVYGLATCLFTLCAMDLLDSDPTDLNDPDKRLHVPIALRSMSPFETRQGKTARGYDCTPTVPAPTPTPTPTPAPTPAPTTRGLIAGILFALHPIHTEAVSSIVGRAETLSACFFCLTYLTYSRFILPSRSLSFSLGVQACAIFPLSILSMLCKEGGLTVLGTCIVLDLASARRQHPTPLPGFHVAVRALLSMCFVVATIVARFALLTVTSFSPTFSEVDNYIHYANDTATQVRSYAYLHYLYVKQLVVPFQLSCDWSYRAFPLVESWSDARLILPFSMYCVAFSVCGVAWWQHNRSLFVATLGLGIVPFVPSSNVLFPVATVLGERLLFLPSMGFTILLSMGIHHICRRLTAVHYMYSPSRNRATQHSSVHLLTWSVVGAIGSVYGAKTWSRNYEWSTALLLFQSAVKVVPTSCKAHVCVAAALNDVGTTASRHDALVYIEKAFQIKSDYAGAHFMKGTVLRELNQFDQAARSFQQTVKHSSELEYKPDVLYLGLVNLGALLMHGGLKNTSHFGSAHHQTTQAQFALSEALVLEPHRYAPNANLAEVLSMLSGTNGKLWDRALRYYSIAAQHPEVQGDLYNNYAIAVYKRAVYNNPHHQGYDVLDQVIDLYRSAIQMDSNYTTPRRNLGKIYYRQKKYKKALQEFQQCVRLEPLDGRCLYDLALCQMRRSQWKQAHVSFQRLLGGEGATTGGGGGKIDLSGIKLDQARANFDTCKKQL